MELEEHVRRQPQQTRSQERVALILDTAAQVFAETGYEAATTNAIAERAGISIGSLYRYFPDKEAILGALAQRYVEQTRAIYDRVITDDLAYLPLPVLFDRLLDPFIEMYHQYPIYHHILLGADISPDIAAAAGAVREESLRRLTGLVHSLAPQLGPERARLVATVSNATVKSLIALLVASDNPAFDRQVTTEVKRMLLGYLEPILAGEV